MKRTILILGVAISVSLLANVVAWTKLAQIQEQYWDDSLKHYSVAVQAERAEILREILDDFFSTDEEKFTALTNSLAVEIDGPVVLSGRVMKTGKHDVRVESATGDLSHWWPVRKDGQLVQPGFFILRNAALQPGFTPAASINGIGRDPLPEVLTNDYGQRIIQMSYRFEPSSK